MINGIGHSIIEQQPARANNKSNKVTINLFEYYRETVACMSPLNQHTPIAIPC
jgi:hypothetical protein